MQLWEKISDSKNIFEDNFHEVNTEQLSRCQNSWHKMSHLTGKVYTEMRLCCFLALRQTVHRSLLTIPTQA